MAVYEANKQMIGPADARTLISTTRTIAMGLALTQEEYLRIMMIYGQAIERMELEQEERSEELTDREVVERYIKKCNYTWTVERLIHAYRMNQHGSYVSHTAEDCIKNCGAELWRLAEKEER